MLTEMIKSSLYTTRQGMCACIPVHEVASSGM